MKMPARPFEAHSTSYPIPPSPGPASGEEGDALPELRPDDAVGGARADSSEVEVASEAFDEVFDVGYLEWLA